MTEPLLCRPFGHRFRYVLSNEQWRTLVYRCTRCGSMGEVPDAPG